MLPFFAAGGGMLVPALVAIASRAAPPRPAARGRSPSRPTSLTDAIALGVFAGLLVGKFAGVLGGAWLAVRLGSDRCPPASAGPTPHPSPCSPGSATP
jgi:Na+/H+ antiporter NhaA